MRLTCHHKRKAVRNLLQPYPPFGDALMSVQSRGNMEDENFSEGRNMVDSLPLILSIIQLTLVPLHPTVTNHTSHLSASTTHQLCSLARRRTCARASLVSGPTRVERTATTATTSAATSPASRTATWTTSPTWTAPCMAGCVMTGAGVFPRALR